MQDFLFTPDRARQPAKFLSGGERNRLLLARLFRQSSNVLVLDEPTNDLDTETLELLEELVSNYDGTLAVGQPRPRILEQRSHQHPGIWMAKAMSSNSAVATMITSDIARGNKSKLKPPAPSPPTSRGTGSQAKKTQPN